MPGGFETDLARSSAPVFGKRVLLFAQKVGLSQEGREKKRLASKQVRDRLKDDILDELEAKHIEVDEEQLNRILKNSIDIEVNKTGVAEEFVLQESTVRNFHSVMTGSSVSNTTRKPPIMARIDMSDALVVGSSLLTGKISSDPTPRLISHYIVKSIARPTVEKITEHQAFTYAVGWEATEEGSFMYKDDLISETVAASKDTTGAR